MVTNNKTLFMFQRHQWWQRLFGNYLRDLHQRRITLLQQHPDLPLPIKALFSAPLPQPLTLINQWPLLAIDFETTGFDAQQDQILSVGYVSMMVNAVDLSTSVNELVNSTAIIKPDSAVINHIDHAMLLQGQALDEVMMRLLVALTGKVGIAHGCFMEQGFISTYLQHKYQLHDCPLLWLDTLPLYQSLYNNQILHHDARLGSARCSVGLPEYQAHNSLFDAIACGELLMVLMHKIYGNKAPNFGQLLNR
ncbi:3'-5' exonuclease [Photobacterium kishitanii]|uniref:3'-5' exonuclease n=1 Tax=Photobacterium kishitanii TaxID=318456 RepID=UPI000435B95B|nr:3'-5' exonuclease [Photobacterium kishitanii]CEO41178.1 DNA polymerase III epsilon subunit [Photobacterium kishitanii]